jgi:ADP-heptose:LPS heptosyltransferase
MRNMRELIKKILLDIYFHARKPFIYALKAAFPPSRMTTGEVSKILIVRIDRMGDLVLSIPVIDSLKLRYPKARITVLVRPYLKELSGMIKSIDSVILYDDKIRAIKEIRREKYDIVFDMHYDYKLEPALIAYLSGARERIGFVWGGREALFTHSVKPQALPGMHMVDLCLELLRPMNIPAVVTDPRIEVPQPSGSTHKMVAIHPGGYYPSQRWPSGSFAALARLIVDEMKEDIVIIGGPDDKELVRDIINEIGERNVRFTYPGMKDMALILKECKVLICNNSGPLHLAQAIGVPTVSTIGPTDRTLWWPRGENAIVVDRGNDVTKITVDEMYEAVKQVVGRSS